MQLRVVLAILAFPTLGCAHAASAGHQSAWPVSDIARGFSPAVQKDVEALRAATAPYHDLSKAQAVGYPANTPKCIADSTMGTMGRHYFNREIFDDKLEIEHPEMLIYQPASDGKWKLAGVEFVVPFRLVPSTATPPRLFGQELRRHEEYKYWYLHVWAWEKNPAGLFSDWNPAIKC